jgi:hypothetical protein
LANPLPESIGLHALGGLSGSKTPKKPGKPHIRATNPTNGVIQPNDLFLLYETTRAPLDFGNIITDVFGGTSAAISTRTRRFFRLHRVVFA